MPSSNEEREYSVSIFVPLFIPTQLQKDLGGLIENLILKTVRITL